MIVIPVMDLCNKQQQLEKVKEEFKEVVASILCEESKERQLEECFDLIQATINLIDKMGTKTEIDFAATRHFEKMKNRNYEIKTMIDVHVR